MKPGTHAPALFVFLVIALLTAPLSAQTTIHVDDDAPNDPGPGDTSISDPLEDGSLDHPFDAIQEGIDAAVNGDTVLVADGQYTGIGNRGMSFLGKAITVASANGPAACIIDGEGIWSMEHYAFMLNSGEGNDSLLRGFTITQFKNPFYAAGINCYNSSPTIIGNVLRDNEGYDGGGTMIIAGHSSSTEASPLVVDNVFTGNLAEYCSGIYISGYARPLIFNNLLYDNYAYPAGYGDTGAIYCQAAEYGAYGTCEPLIVGCSIVDNHGTFYSYASGIWVSEFAGITVIDSIVYGNEYEQIAGYGYGTFSYSNVEGGISGTGNIAADPLFTSGPHGDYYLSQVAAGQVADSPCLDAASDLADAVCATLSDGDTCLGDRSTRSDGHLDAGQADMGYHYTAFGTVGAWLTCLPSAGTLPFQTRLEATMENRFTGITRRMAARINFELANGQSFNNWRAGFTNIGPDGAFSASWMQIIPVLASLVGDNVFTLVAQDVTPAPYNQPPYAPSGDTARNGCTVTGVAP